MIIMSTQIKITTLYCILLDSDYQWDIYPPSKKERQSTFYVSENKQLCLSTRYSRSATNNLPVTT